MDRRSFIASAAAGLSALPQFLRAEEIPMNGPIGFQSWVVRENFGKDFEGTLQKMKKLGYNSFELCSPAGYKDLGFGPLQKMSASYMKHIMADIGFTSISCHYGFKELKEHAQERIDFAKSLGHEQMICSSFQLPKEATLSDWRKACDDLNKFGEQAKKAGIQAGFHNHNGEFEKLEGELIYDVLLKQLDPDLVKMQFQVWVIIMGYKAADYFKQYPGRFISAHLYDWSGKGEERVALGKGVVDYKEFFAAAKASGVKNFFVEMDEPLLKDSAEFLKNLS